MISTVRVRILGSAAGGGVPQWNCRCPNCEAARSGSVHVLPRTQSSVAISADGRWWFLLNVSPDVRQQVLAFASLGPASDDKRGTAIAGCILTDAELDHTSGLLQLREGCPFAVYSTEIVRSWLNDCFPVKTILASFSQRPWHCIELNSEFELTFPDGSPSGLLCRAYNVDGDPPRFVSGTTAAAEAVIGLVIQDSKTGGRLAYFPCAASIEPIWSRHAEEVDCLLFDGTFWSDDEPQQWDISRRSAREMSHLPVGGDSGSLSWMAGLTVRHRAFLHINNTNPMLDRRTAEFALVNDHGVRIAEDGDEFLI